METNRSVIIKTFKLRKVAVKTEPFLYFRVFVSGKELVDLCFQSLQNMQSIYSCWLPKEGKSLGLN